MGILTNLLAKCVNHTPTHDSVVGLNFDVLGLQARDRVSGVYGSITAVSESLSGQIQITIEPLSTDNTSTPTYSYDHHQIDVFKAGSFAARYNRRMVVNHTEPKFKLGERVQSLLNQKTGVINTRVTYLNGCILYSIHPTDNTEAFFVFQPLIQSIHDDSDDSNNLLSDINVLGYLVNDPEIEKEKSNNFSGGPTVQSINQTL